MLWFRDGRRWLPGEPFCQVGHLELTFSSRLWTFVLLPMPVNATLDLNGGFTQSRPENVHPSTTNLLPAMAPSRTVQSGSLWPVDSVRDVAESVGIQGLSDEVALA